MSSDRAVGRGVRVGRAVSVFGLLGASALAGCVSLDDATRNDGEPRVYAGMGKTLSTPSDASRDRVLVSFLASHGAAPQGDELRLVEQNTSPNTGLEHLRYEQQIGGLRVAGSYVKATLSPRGELVHVIEQLATPPAAGLAEPSITPAEALGAALDELGYEQTTPDEVARDAQTVVYDKGTSFDREPTVERVALETESGLEQGYLVETWSEQGNLLHHTLVDAEGGIVSVELRTNTDSYNVFTEDPTKGPQTVVTGPGSGSAESPAGWLSGAQSTAKIGGNNANAYLDTNNDNVADSGGSAVADGNFLGAVDLGAAPSTTGNKAVAVQNLFYLNNVVHDTLYAHGFTEAAGNFQVDNFGAGGLGSDPVQAEAQDGGGLDNANFATPNDGSKPRMQMYLWSGTGPNAQVSISGQSFGGTTSALGPALTTKTGLLAIANDGFGASTTDACETITVSLSGKIALVDRGTCDFSVKILNVQKAGAIAVVVANNIGEDFFAMGGSGRRITIPSMMVGKSSGDALRALAGMSATLSTLPPPVMVDGTLDADIVFHEYGHGLTWRMVGSMSGPLAGAIGEGASDVVAFLMNGDDVVGEYAFGNPAGIRRFPYAAHPMLYHDVTGAEVHDDGEVYAAAMWRLRELFQGAGKTDADLLEAFVGGLSYTPAKPAFEHMRDGMLQDAAARGTGDECLIWTAFAERGIGVGAKGTVKGSRVTVVESFTKPASCP